jgi:hypothetical protein
VHGRDGTENWYRSIVLAGGSTMVPGLPARLTHELARHAPAGCQPEVLAPTERKHAAWLGGSILASLAVVDQMWITKEEYDENGPLIVHRKVRMRPSHWAHDEPLPAGHEAPARNSRPTRRATAAAHVRVRAWAWCRAQTF